VKPVRILALFLLICALPAVAGADTLSGTITNGTTQKPAAGDEVILIKLGEGMEEAARVKTDSHGKFSFKLEDSGGPHLIRVEHQGVTYNQMAPPGTPSVNLDVYDVSKKLAGISVTADVMRFQAQGNELQGVRLFAVDNKSQPPRTQMNDQNFEFYLPPGAELDQGMAMTAGGEPLNMSPVPQKEKNCYAFIFPLRPGETQFQVTFHMAYSGQASIDPKNLYGSQHFVVMLPKSMQFTPGLGTSFQAMKDPRDPDAVVQVASNTLAGQPLSFNIAGMGVMTNQNSAEQSAGPQQAQNEPPQDSSRPGGGLGPPIDAPDPLEHYRWYILGGFALALAVGAVYIARRPQMVRGGHAPASSHEASEAPARPKKSGGSAMLLEALKDELFQLEVEHKQGQITQQEYEKAKAALDQTLERAVSRSQPRR